MTEDLRDPPETIDLLRRVEDGDREALDQLFSMHRERLLRMVHLRLPRILQGRIDASDVVQEAMTEAYQRLPEFLRDRSMSFFLWLRFLTRQKLLGLHRHHVAVQARDPRREVALFSGPTPEATTDGLVAQLLGKLTTPTQAAVRAEMRLRLQDALNGMDPGEREVLSLRHFEQLSNGEAARELEIGEAAASKRYIRALKRLRGILEAMRLDGSAVGRPSD